MKAARERRAAFAWLELLLALAILMLLVQLFPSAFLQLVMALDMRTWTPWSWFVACGVFFVVLCVIRFAPEIVDGFREQIMRGRAGRANKKKLDPTEQQRRLDEERKLYQRMIEARKRQVL